MGRVTSNYSMITKSLLEFSKQKTWPSAQAEMDALTLVTSLLLTIVASNSSRLLSFLLQQHIAQFSMYGQESESLSNVICSVD